MRQAPAFEGYTCKYFFLKQNGSGEKLKYKWGGQGRKKGWYQLSRGLGYFQGADTYVPHIVTQDVMASREWMSEGTEGPADPGVQATLGGTACWIKHTRQRREQGLAGGPAGKARVTWECPDTSRRPGGSGQWREQRSHPEVCLPIQLATVTLQCDALQNLEVSEVHGKNFFLV